MAAFDPIDWFDGRSWLRPPERRSRRPGDINREVVHRWLAAVAFCLCFAGLSPPAHLPLAFAGLLLVAALASAGVALVRGERPMSPHLTAWDEAALSLALGLGVGLWFAPAASP